MIEIREESNICIIKVKCEISYTNIEVIKKEIAENLKEEHKGYILNLENCTYINSSAFEYLVELYRILKSKQKKLIICSMVPDVKALFDITRLDKLIDICKNEKQALAAMNVTK